MSSSWTRACTFDAGLGLHCPEILCVVVRRVHRHRYVNPTIRAELTISTLRDHGNHTKEGILPSLDDYSALREHRCRSGDNAHVLQSTVHTSGISGPLHGYYRR